MTSPSFVIPDYKREHANACDILRPPAMGNPTEALNKISANPDCHKQSGREWQMKQNAGWTFTRGSLAIGSLAVGIDNDFKQSYIIPGSCGYTGVRNNYFSPTQKKNLQW